MYSKTVINKCTVIISSMSQIGYIFLVIKHHIELKNFFF